MPEPGMTSAVLSGQRLHQEYLLNSRVDSKIVFPSTDYILLPGPQGVNGFYPANIATPAGAGLSISACFLGSYPHRPGRPPPPPAGLRPRNAPGSGELFIDP